ncbi:MAG: DUF433 domain-containing protein [Gemmataceae bacterium]
MAATATPGIEKTPNVCFGAARIGNHRIPVWLVVLYKKMGASDTTIFEAYPQLTPDDLAACWDYYAKEPVEIERKIWYNHVAGNVPPGTPVPASAIIAGKLLGLSDAEVAESFDEPLTPAAIAAAWREYLAAPQQVEREIAVLRLAG